MNLGFFLSWFSNDMGIDLGTANTVVYVKGKGIVLREPSIVAIKRDTKEVIGVGDEAKRMLGKTPKDILLVRPLKDGVITDFEIAQGMIRFFITKIHNRKTFRAPRIAIGIPSGITEVEKRAVREAAEQSGAREVYLIAEPIAAALGAELPINEAAGNLILDIGGGTTEVAVISMGEMVIWKSKRIAGDEMDEAILTYIKRKYSLLIGEGTAEEIKIRIGSAYPMVEEMELEVRGRDLIEGVPKSIKINSHEIREALSEVISVIVGTVKEVLEETPPELSGDIVDRGLLLTGGNSMLRGLNKLIAERTGLPVNITEDPLSCVALGTGKYLERVAVNR